MKPNAPLLLLCAAALAGPALAQELMVTRPATSGAIKPPAAQAAMAERAAPGLEADDYEFVSWCVGSLTSYIALYEQVMPEVTRIESQFREPDNSLEEDLKVYADLRRESEQSIEAFGKIAAASEKLAAKTGQDPIAVRGALAQQRGRNVWSAANAVSRATLAQEWMSWTMPARCDEAASNLEKAAVLEEVLPRDSALVASITRVSDEDAPAETAKAP